MVLAIHWNQRKTVVRMTGEEADSRIQVFPHFSKVHFISLLLQEKVKSINNIQHVFCSEPFLTEAAYTLSSESGSIKLLMRATQHLSIKPPPRALNWVCEHLRFISLCSVHLLARRALR